MSRYFITISEIPAFSTRLAIEEDFGTDRGVRHYLRLLGFRWRHTDGGYSFAGGLVNYWIPGWSVDIPCWFLAGVFLILPLYRLRSRLRGDHRLACRCSVCGYRSSVRRPLVARSAGRRRRHRFHEEHFAGNLCTGIRLRPAFLLRVAKAGLMKFLWRLAPAVATVIGLKQ